MGRGLTFTVHVTGLPLFEVMAEAIQRLAFRAQNAGVDVSDILAEIREASDEHPEELG